MWKSIAGLVGTLLATVLILVQIKNGNLDGQGSLDLYLHFFGGFFGAMFVRDFMKEYFIEGHWFKNLIFILGATALIGVLWEFFEYSWIWYIKPEWDVLGVLSGLTNYLDTMMDLVMDLSGGLLLAILSFRQVFLGQRKSP